MIGIVKFPSSLDHLQPSTKAPPSPSSFILGVPVLPKSWALFSDAKLKHRDRVLGEVERVAFIALPGKRGHSRLAPSRLCPLGKIGRDLRVQEGKGVLQIRSRADASLHSSFLLESLYVVKVGVRRSWEGSSSPWGYHILTFFSGIKNSHKRREW